MIRSYLSPFYFKISVNDPDRIQIGARVRVLQPDYAAGEIGIVISQEELLDGQPTGRWIIQIEPGDVLLSLPPQDFELLD
ncbi:hypothetical protein [Egbenema bharatensis]|uniref:hypothetical protein n=1 Tax=Egbenema bharatensis TaxID=3463334 RepID=UPI003A84DC95